MGETREKPFMCLLAGLWWRLDLNKGGRVQSVTLENPASDDEEGRSLEMKLICTSRGV